MGHGEMDGQGHGAFRGEVDCAALAWCRRLDWFDGGTLACCRCLDGNGSGRAL